MLKSEIRVTIYFLEVKKFESEVFLTNGETEATILNMEQMESSCGRSS